MFASMIFKMLYIKLRYSIRDKEGEEGKETEKEKEDYYAAPKLDDVIAILRHIKRVLHRMARNIKTVSLFPCSYASSKKSKSIELENANFFSFWTTFCGCCGPRWEM